MLMLLPMVSLVLAGALAFINLWLGVRISMVRRAENVLVGDGGSDRLLRRMRAHANFAENAWLVLALVLVIELATGTSLWLWAAAAAFVIARILHAFGMDGWLPGRMAGVTVTWLLLALLGLWAIGIAATFRSPAELPLTEAVPARG